MSTNKDKDNNRIHYKYVEEEEFDGNDIWDEIQEEYFEEDEIDDKFIHNEDKRSEKHVDKEECIIRVNSKLRVDFDVKNKMIYLSPGKAQFFTVDVSKSCGNVIIKYKGCCSSKGIRGNLAVYKIVQSGIVAETYAKLDPRKKDILYFTAIDECTKECCDFVIIFSSNMCGCY